jgi:16S rRNA (guanine966-N2)-methyltransferase
VTLVEADATAVRVLRANVAALGLPGVEVVPVKVETFLRERVEPAYDVVFLDPPYALDVAPVLAACVPLVADLVVVERATRDGAPAFPVPLTGEKTRRYGDTSLWYGRRS